jgi:hypothetical protein
VVDLGFAGDDHTDKSKWGARAHTRTHTRVHALSQKHKYAPRGQEHGEVEEVVEDQVLRSRACSVGMMLCACDTVQCCHGAV